jgi:MoaA/NifB/PqqE/SkfB family radical SAM enzyme
MFELKSPLLLVIDITNECNLSCNYCFQDFRSDTKNSINLGTITEILSEAKDMGIFEINICGGEPFKHKDIINIISEVKRVGFNLSIVTNGTLINKKTALLLNELDVIKNMQISFDSHIDSIHNKLRGGYHQAIRGLDYLLSYDSPPHQ